MLYVHHRIKRPWGYYDVLLSRKTYKVKEIALLPKKSISLQKHKYRSEHWSVVEGKIYVFVDSKYMVVKKNESIFVPKGAMHKVYNRTSKTVRFIEVQIGSKVFESDIRRFDSYDL